MNETFLQMTDTPSLAIQCPMNLQQSVQQESNMLIKDTHHQNEILFKVLIDFYQPFSSLSQHSFVFHMVSLVLAQIQVE